MTSTVFEPESRPQMGCPTSEQSGLAPCAPFETLRQQRAEPTAAQVAENPLAQPPRWLESALGRNATPPARSQLQPALARAVVGLPCQKRSIVSSQGSSSGEQLVEWKKSKNFPQSHSLAVSPLFPPNSGRPQRMRNDENWLGGMHRSTFSSSARSEEGGGHWVVTLPRQFLPVRLVLTCCLLII